MSPDPYEAKNKLYSEARYLVLTVLSTEDNPWPAKDATDEEERELTTEAWQARYNLLNCKRDMLKHMASVERSFANARTYLNGYVGLMPSYGLLQSDGIHIDMLCAQFPLLVTNAIDAEYRHLAYRQKGITPLTRNTDSVYVSAERNVETDLLEDR